MSRQLYVIVARLEEPPDEFYRPQVGAVGPFYSIDSATTACAKLSARYTDRRLQVLKLKPRQEVQV